MSTFNVGESAICTDSQNWYHNKVVTIRTVNVLDGIAIYGVQCGNIEFALRETGLGKISMRDQIDVLTSPVARELLGGCYDEMASATLDAIQNPETEFARHIHQTGRNGQTPVLAEVDYLAQERELRILIYTRQVEQTGKISFQN